MSRTPRTSTTSTTGALAADWGTITLAAPAGTAFSSASSYTIQDVTTATNCGLETWATSNAGATVTLTVGCTIGAGATVQVTATGVSNPATASSGDVLTITTSSDILSAHTNTYSIGAPSARPLSLNAVTSPITYGAETAETFSGR